jgi:hypothetical protein
VDYGITLEHDLRGFFLDATLITRADPPAAHSEKKVYPSPGLMDK